VKSNKPTDASWQLDFKRQPNGPFRRLSAAGDTNCAINSAIGLAVLMAGTLMLRRPPSKRRVIA